jgi:hypothetical protein
MRRFPWNEGVVKADTCAALRTAEIKASFENIVMQVTIVDSKECGCRGKTSARENRRVRWKGKRNKFEETTLKIART